MKLFSAILGGVAGATALTLLHESVRRLYSDAPRMDLLGMEALGKSLKAAHIEVPEEDDLFKITMAGDMISNSLYYSLVALAPEKKVVPLGAILGLAAGFGAVYLPKPLGLDDKPSNRTTETRLMTVGLYLVGGLVASITSTFVEKKQKG